MIPTGGIDAPYLLALPIGVIAGLRTMTAPAAVSWAARRGRLPLQGTRLAFLGFAATPYVISALAVAEMVTDTLPMTSSRTVPLQFGARLVSGGLCGAAIGLPSRALAGGVAAGMVGAFIGTLAGSAARGWLAGALGRDLPAALLEDAVAVGGATLTVTALA